MSTEVTVKAPVPTTETKMVAIDSDYVQVGQAYQIYNTYSTYLGTYRVLHGGWLLDEKANRVCRSHNHDGCFKTCVDVPKEPKLVGYKDLKHLDVVRLYKNGSPRNGLYICMRGGNFHNRIHVYELPGKLECHNHCYNSESDWHQGFRFEVIDAVIQNAKIEMELPPPF